MKLALQLHRLPKVAVVNWQQAKDFLTTTTNKFQAATEGFTNTSSETVQNAIAQARTQGFAYAVTNWLQAHPVTLRSLNLILWGIEHPIISFVIIILTVTTFFGIVKALNRLLETIGWSLLKAPFKLIATGLRLTQLGIKQKFTQQHTSEAKANITASQNSQHRLAEISQRLQLLQKEYNELLQEAATILATNSK